MNGTITETRSENPEETYTFAQQHGYLAASPIFRPLPKMPDKKRVKREFTFNGGERTANPYQLEITCFSELDTEDESVLIAMLAIIGTHTRCMTLHTGNTFRTKLDEEGGSLTQKTVGTITTRNEILRLLGWPRTGNSYKRINASLKRLQQTNIDYYPKNAPSQFSRLICVNFLPAQPGSGNSERLFITLNALSAAVIFGQSDAGISIHQLLERRLLKSRLALGIYSQCVYLVRQGDSRPILLSKLLDRVYVPEKNQKITPRQRDYFMATIRDWPLPGWSLQFEGRGKFTRVAITRPPDPASTRGLKVPKANIGLPS